MRFKNIVIKARLITEIGSAMILACLLVPASNTNPRIIPLVDRQLQQSNPDHQKSREILYPWPSEPALTLPPEAESSINFSNMTGLLTDCSELALPGEDPPETCVFGFVVLDGVPQAGIEVALSSEAGTVVAYTGPGPSFSQPYYIAALDQPPLSAIEGEIASAQATLGSEENTTYFLVDSGAKQVDIWYSSTCGPTYVSGMITVDTIWQRECGPYIVTDNLLIYQDVTLTIFPGTTIRFYPDKSLRIDGELLALGDNLALLHFTADGLNAPGAWAHILFSPTSVDAVFDPPGQYIGGTILVYSLVDYAGGTTAVDRAAIRIDDSAPFLTHTFIRHSGGDGVRAYNLGMINFTGGAVTDSAKWGVYNAGEAAEMIVATSEIARNLKGGIYSTGTIKAWVLANRIHDNPENYAVWILSGNSEVGLNWIENNAGGLYLTRLSNVAQNVILGSTINGGLRLRDNVGTLIEVINYNVFYHNANPTGYGGAIYVDSGHYDIHENVIADNQAMSGGGITIWGAHSVELWKNSIVNNTSTAQGGGLYEHRLGTAYIQHNTILNNRAGASMAGVYIESYPLFQQNNIYGNLDYDLFNSNLVDTPDLVAEYNWWGTANGIQIMQHIWDYLDDNSLSLVDYNPWSTGPLTVDAPISPPTGLDVSVTDSSLEMSWNANPESDTHGYQVYYDVDNAGFPYEGDGAQEGKSPIDVGNTLSFTLTGLTDGIYHVSVTAYDAAADREYDQPDGHESWFANDKVAVIGTPPGAFGKISPTSGKTNVQPNPKLSWEASNGATSYEYCYDMTNDSSCSDWTSSGLATSVDMSELLPSTMYYWQVRAVNNIGITYADGSSTSFWWFSTVSISKQNYIPLVVK